jgi:hypothetical protein
MLVPEFLEYHLEVYLMSFLNFNFRFLDLHLSFFTLVIVFLESLRKIYEIHFTNSRLVFRYDYIVTSSI